MATPTVSPRPEVQKHYAAQFALSTALVTALRRIWPTFDPSDPAGTLPLYKQALAAVTSHYGAVSSSLALDHFGAMRAEAGISDPFSPPLIDALPDAKLQSSIGWATSDITVTGGDTEVHLPSAESVTITFDRVEAAAQKLVADAGRNELLSAVEADRLARGWARVTRADACYFCRMLATRGAVYKSAGTAGRDANARFVGDGEAKFHNTCHCTVEPSFSPHYEAPAHTRADMAAWDEVTKDFSGADKVLAWRRWVEGRSEGGAPLRKSSETSGFNSLAVEQLRHQLAVIEPLKDSEWRTKQIERINARLAELA